MLKLRDIMTRDVVSAAPDLTIREAMELLSERHVSGAPVVDGGKVVGVFSASDLLALSRGPQRYDSVSHLQATERAHDSPRGCDRRRSDDPESPLTPT